MNRMLLTLLVFLGILSILVVIHELGHFLAAKKFGIKVLEKHLRISDLDTLQSAYDYYAPKVGAVPYVNLKGIKFLLDTTAESNPKAKNIQPEEIGDNTLLREIEASGFLKQVSPGR